MIRCLAVDDESLALDLLEDNIRKVPFLELAGKCKSASEAIEILRNEKIDLLFLDIRMPDISGIQLLKSLSQKPLVIFTTAYEKYALQGYELDVLDYLLKPFPFERFLKAVNKARDYLSYREKENQPGEPTAETGFLFVRADYKLVRIGLREISYIEGLKDYIKIYSGDRPVITQMGMNEIMGKLPSGTFIRVHRSFIVNLMKIEYIQRNLIIIGKKEIPVSDHYKENFYKIIKQNKPDN